MAEQVLVDLEPTDVRAGVARARAELDHATERHAETKAARELSASRPRDGFAASRVTGRSAVASSTEGPP